MNNELDYVYAVVGQFGTIYDKFDTELEAREFILKKTLEQNCSERLDVFTCPR